MTRWRGFSEWLQTPDDLLRKMSGDFDRMREAPGDPFPAFDFFVGAEHIVDWRWPRDPAKRKEVRSRDPAKTVSHLANGAKHFEATDPRHESVQGIASEGDFGTAVLGRAHLGEMVLGSAGRHALVITMADGRRVEAATLAELVLAYWRVELGEGGMHEAGP
jgi:hypothetical protein